MLLSEIIFSYHFLDPDQLAVLAGDIFKLPSAVTSPSLTRANYYADESVNRIDLMTGNDKNPYFNAYEGLFAWNLIVEDVPDATECTEVQRRQLIAQGLVLRAMHYFYLANFYADQYDEATKDKLSVPLITSASVEAPSPQVTLQTIYEFMLDDLNKAVEDLPVHSESILHPNRALGYGMLARVYLSMGDYDNALKNASLALEQNDQLFNWIDLYEADKERYDDPKNYTSGVAGNPETDNVENYIYCYGSCFSLSPTDLAAFPVSSFSPPLGSFPAGSSDHPIRFQKIHLLCYKNHSPHFIQRFPLSPIFPADISRMHSTLPSPVTQPPRRIPSSSPCSVQIHKHCMWTPASVPDTADAVRFCRSHPVLLFLQIHSCFPSSLSGIHIHKPQNSVLSQAASSRFFHITYIYAKIPEDHSSRILFSLHI